MIKSVLKIIKEENTLMKNSFSVIFSTIVGGILSMIAVFAISRILGPHDFGIFKTLTAFFGFFTYVFDFGFQNTLMKYIARYTSAGRKNDVKVLIQNLFFFRLVVLTPIIILSLYFSTDIARILLKNQDLKYLISPAVIFLILTFSDLTKPIIIGLQNFKLISIVNIVVPLASIFILIPSALYLGLSATIIGFGVTCFIGGLISFGFLIRKNYIARPRKNIFNFPKLIISYGLPSYFSNIPSYLFLAIIPLLSLFFKQTEIGYYSFAFSFYTATMIVPVSMSQALFPRFSSYTQKDNYKAIRTLKNTIIVYVFISMLEIISVFLFANKFISLVTPLFLPSLPLIYILVTSASILGLGSLFIAYLTARKKLQFAFLLNILVYVVFAIISFSALKFTI